jgi:hypothetical protein
VTREVAEGTYLMEGMKFSMTSWWTGAVTDGAPRAGTIEDHTNLSMPLDQGHGGFYRHGVEHFVAVHPPAKAGAFEWRASIKMRTARQSG